MALGVHFGFSTARELESDECKTCSAAIRLRLLDWATPVQFRDEYCCSWHQPGTTETIINLMLLQEAFEARRTVLPLTVNGETGAACLCNLI